MNRLIDAPRLKIPGLIVPLKAVRSNPENSRTPPNLPGAGVWIAPTLAAHPKSPNEKLNIAVIGCAGKGAGGVSIASRQNLVALCDVNEKQAGKAFEAYPNVKKYQDYRKMLDEMAKQIDAVIISTPDHSHAPSAVMAMKLGKHVYREKPTAHSIYECREMADAAAKMKVATQMGNQGHASKGCRSLVEIIRSGVVGKVKEAHAMTMHGIAIRADAPPPILKTWRKGTGVRNGHGARMP